MHTLFKANLNSLSASISKAHLSAKKQACLIPFIPHNSMAKFAAGKPPIILPFLSNPQHLSGSVAQSMDQIWQK